MKGRVLGLDFGLKRVGVALSDPARTIASPLEVYTRRGAEQDGRHFQRLVDEEHVECIVVGLPVHGDGAESAISTQARAWGRWIGAECGRPVTFFEERFTSREAERRLREGGLSGKAVKSRIDMLAAQIMLQDYLDAGCPERNSGADALEDKPGPQP